MRPEEKSEAMETSSVKENHIRKDLNWTYTSPWNLVICNYEC